MLTAEPRTTHAASEDAAERVGKGYSMGISKLYTYGSAEALLNLLFAVQGTCDVGTDPCKVLKIIKNYTREKPKGHPFENYFPSSGFGRRRLISEPFLNDLQELRSQGLVRLHPDGLVEVVLLGQCMAFARSLPECIEDLGKRVECLASADRPS